MKKLVTILSFAALLASCTGKASKTDQTEESSDAVELKDTTVTDTTKLEMVVDTTEMADSIVAETPLEE